MQPHGARAGADAVGRPGGGAPTCGCASAGWTRTGHAATLRHAGGAAGDRLAAGGRLQPGQPGPGGRAWRWGRASRRRPSPAGIAAQRAVPGRLERVANEAGVLCVVDYAHTPDALERALATLRPLTRGRLHRGVRLRRRSRSDQAADHGRGGGAAGRRGHRHLATTRAPRIPARIVADGLRGGAARRAASSVPAEALAAAERGYHVEVDRRDRHPAGGGGGPAGRHAC